MLKLITKAVDIALSVEAPRKIKDYHIQHISKAILDCVLPKVQLQVAYPNILSVDQMPINTPLTTSLAPTLAASLVNKQKSWAKVASNVTCNCQKAITKLSLKQPFQRMHVDLRLMVLLAKNLSHRNEHFFVLQKKTNAIFSINVSI